MAAATAVATTAENGGNGVVALMQRWQPFLWQELKQLGAIP